MLLRVITVHGSSAMALGDLSLAATDTTILCLIQINVQ